MAVPQSLEGWTLPVIRDLVDARTGEDDTFDFKEVLNPSKPDSPEFNARLVAAARSANQRLAPRLRRRDAVFVGAALVTGLAIALVGCGGGAGEPDQREPTADSADATPQVAPAAEQVEEQVRQPEERDEQTADAVKSEAPGTITITSGPHAPRQGDVVVYAAETRDSHGTLVEDLPVTWAVVPSSAGLFAPDGQFVGYTPGPAQVVATVVDPVTEAEVVAAPLAITITARGLSGSFRVVGHGALTTRNSGHIAVHSGVAYTGTVNCERSCGDRLSVWDIRDPAEPTLTDAVVAGGCRINDVMVRADGAVAVMTHEGSAGGITLLDLSDPAHPTVITRLTEGLGPGTHNLWIDGDLVYVAIESFADQSRSRLVIVDITNLRDPAVVGVYGLGAGVTHDVQVRDGLALVSHWEAGLIILDVGGGGAGGSPAQAVELSRTPTPIGWTHNAWYWPATGYVFLAEEPQVRNRPAPTIYVMDAREPRSPKLVATYTSPGWNPHNFWLDEDRGILYVAWRGHGVQAIDVTGTLLGRLEQQGRQIARLKYDAGDCRTASRVGPTGIGTCAYSVQVQDGLVYVSDIRSGIWVLEPSFLD